ncbi:MAG: polyprenyl synthetase family protein [Muribaculaceae bacterium]
MQTLKEYISTINEAIESTVYPKMPNRLYEPIKYTMSHGGKRLRPVLTLMCCEAFGSHVKDAIPQALGVEFFHNFTLLHDDVMDKADIRRGLPTVHCKWDENTAILSGDAMLTMATQFVAHCNSSKLKAVIDLFNTTAMEIYEGQQYDMNFESHLNISVDDYIMMIRLKTSVLIGCACKMGAIMGNASTHDCDKLYDFGVNLGLAFQLQDDWLDVYGDASTFGKAIGGDILNNKKTFLLTNALSQAKDADKAELLKWIDTNDITQNDNKIKAVTNIYNRLGIDNLCKNSIDNYITTSITTLNEIKMPQEAHNTFIAFVDTIMNRNK